MARPALSLKGRALRYLSMREHSRLELGRKLQRYAQDGDDIATLLDWLEANQFLSQSRFSESLVYRRASRFGNARIVAELKNHGIENDDLNVIKATLLQDEAARAREVWLRKFGTPATDALEKSKQMRFLLQRGFSHRAILEAMQLRDSDIDAGGEFL